VAAEYIRIAATLPETVPAVGNPRRVINTPLGAPAAARTVRVCLATAGGVHPESEEEPVRV